jgi:predicted Zn-dependent protease with MMP-like domain
MHIDRDKFEALVAAALDELPEPFLDRLDNVDVIIEPWADAATLRRAGVAHPAQLMGFYQGVPQTRRTRRYTLVLPDKITLYQRPIEMRSRTEAEIQQRVIEVLRHEIAHHFGIDDARLDELKGG